MKEQLGPAESLCHDLRCNEPWEYVCLGCPHHFCEGHLTMNPNDFAGLCSHCLPKETERRKAIATQLREIADKLDAGKVWAEESLELVREIE